MLSLELRIFLRFHFRPHLHLFVVVVFVVLRLAVLRNDTSCALGVSQVHLACLDLKLGSLCTIIDILDLDTGLCPANILHLGIQLAT